MGKAARRIPSLYRQTLALLLLVVAVVLIAGGLAARHAPASQLLLSLLAGVVCAGAFGAWAAHNVGGSLRQLAGAARAIAAGEAPVLAEEAPVRELYDLTESLQVMAQAVRSTIETLTAERNQATAIVESMAEGVIAVDGKGRMLLINPSACRLFDLTPASAVGQSFAEFVRDPELQGMVQRLLQERRRVTDERTLLQPKERVLRIHGIPCDAQRPTDPAAVLVVQDVTEHYRYEQLRKEFVANVSHELKSPLTAIRSLTETLLEGALEDANTNRRFVRLIEEDAARLSGLIDDLLSLSQLESQALPLQRAPVELAPLAESVVRSLDAAIAQRRLTVRVDVPSGLRVQADADRLRQVLVNLIDNAVKYNTDGGRVAVAASIDGGLAKVTVEDTGIGIPPEDLPRIFERFYRVDKARSRQLGGTGLGLSIVKHIVEAHGGTVSVESRPQQGSRFTVTLPLAA